MQVSKTNKIIMSVAALSVLSLGLHAADWLSIAGTEPSMIKVDGKKVKNTNTKPRFWGFIQVGYQQNYGDILIKSGVNKTPFSMLTPDLNSQSGFEVNRARLAVRGMIDKANTLDYFFMTEFGEDGITAPAGHTTGNHLTDASITYRGIAHLNIRMGQFKYPGSEEGMRAVFASEYRNFTKVTNELLLERFLPNNAIAGTDANGDVTYQAAPTQSVGAFRDRGVEFFDTENVTKKISVTVAVMAGSGTGLSSSNASGDLTYYGYLASQYSFGKGKGYFTQALKGFAWYQSGKRKLNNTKYDRIRYGVGVDYFHNGLRLDAEYIKAKGMIYNGAKDADIDPYNEDWQYQIVAGKNNVSDGYYFNAQYYVIPKKVELLARYDYLDRLSNSSLDEREFKTTTIGLSYHFKGPNRIDFNYAFRDATAPGNAAAQKVLDYTGNLLSIQGTLKF
ncbi:hypothetical protein [Sulfurimonas sp.]